MKLSIWWLARSPFRGMDFLGIQALSKFGFGTLDMLAFDLTIPGIRTPRAARRTALMRRNSGSRSRRTNCRSKMTSVIQQLWLKTTAVVAFGRA